MNYEKRNIFIIGAGFSKHFFNTPTQNELITNILNNYLKSLNKDTINIESYMEMPSENANYKDCLVYGLPLIYYIFDYWKLSNIYKEDDENTKSLNIINKLFKKLIIKYIELKLISGNDLANNYEKDWSFPEEIDNLEGRQSFIISNIYNQIMNIKNELIMLINEIKKFDNDIEIISTKILKTILWNDNNNNEIELKTINFYIWKSIEYLLKDKKPNDLIKNNKLLKVLENSIIINLNWDNNIELFFLENNKRNNLEVLDPNKFNFFKDNSLYNKTIMMKPHSSSDQNIILPSYFKNFSEFNFKFFKKIFENIKREDVKNNIIIFGLGFNKADSYIYHQIFNLISKKEDFENIYIYSKDKNLPKEIKKYIAIDIIEKNIFVTNDKPEETINELLKIINN